MKNNNYTYGIRASVASRIGFKTIPFQLFCPLVASGSSWQRLGASNDVREFLESTGLRKDCAL